MAVYDPNLPPQLKRFADATKDKVAPPTQEQNKLDFQKIVGKLDSAGLSTDIKALDKSLDAAKKKGVITPEEHASARAYLAANPTPGTNFQVHIAEADASQNVKDQNTKALIDDGKGGTTLGTVAEAKASGADFLPVKDPKDVVMTGHIYNQIRRSVDRLADPKLLKVFDDPTDRAVIATATSETEAHNFGALIPGLGGLMIPVPGGTGRFIDSLLQNRDIPNKKEVQEYLANFWEAREASMNMMRLQTEGKQGARSQTQMNAIIAQLPGGATPNSAMAKKQLENMFANLDDYGRGVPDKLPGYEKYQPKKYDQSGGGAGSGPGSSGKAVSLAQARQLPINQGKTDDQIRADIEAHGHKVVD
jgi:hypothetical protein